MTLKNIARTALVGLVSFIVVGGAASPEVRACSCGRPTGTFVTESGLLPSDARGVVWAGLVPWYYHDVPPAGVERFRVEREVTSGEWKVVLHEVRDLGGHSVLVSPSAPMKAGDRFRMTALPTEDDQGGSITVEVSPIALGPLLAKAKLEVAAPRKTEAWLAASGSCGRKVEVQAHAISLQLPDEAKPFRHALLYSTLVGDGVWLPTSSMCQVIPPGRSWLELGSDLLYRRCGSDPEDLDLRMRGLVEGRWRVKMRATLPGTDVAFEAEAEVVIACESKTE